MNEARTHHDDNDCPVIPPHVARYEHSAINAKSDENQGAGSESARDTYQDSILVYIPAGEEVQGPWPD